MPKKLVSKKTAVRKKKTASKTLKDASPEHYFVLTDGNRLRNIQELADSLENMDDHVFFHHANDQKNDFATWIKDIFEDEKLADDVRNMKDRKQIQFVLYKHIASTTRKRG